MADINLVSLIAIIIFYIVILGVGVCAARRRKETEEETMLAGRSIGLVLGTFSMTATWVGGGYINGTAEAVYDKDLGLVWTQAPWAFALSLTVGGLVFAKIMRNKGYFTLYDPLQERYGPRMGTLLYIPDLFSLVFYQGAILSALGSTISVMIEVSRVPSIIASSCIAVLYTLIGGLYSVTYTDVVQVTLIFVGLWLSIPFAMTHPAVSSISENSSEAWIGELPINLLGVWTDYALLMIFGGVPIQDYFQRVLSCKTARKAQGLSIAASIGCILLATPAVLIGAIGASTDWKKTDFFKPSSNSTNQTVTFDKTVILPMVLQYLCPPVVSAIGLGAVAAAIMSSADSSILSAGTIFARNVYKHTFRPKASEREILWVMRIFMLVLGVASTAVALMADSIYVLTAITVDLIYVITFPQFVCAIYIPDVNTYGSIMGYIVGVILRVGGGESLIEFPAAIKYPYYDEELQMQLFPFRTFAMIVSFATLVFVSYLTKYLFSREILPAKYDFLQYFELKQYELDKTHATGYEDGALVKHEKHDESKL